VSTMI